MTNTICTAGPEDPRRASREILQLSFLLTPSSDLPVATTLSTLPRLPSPRQGLQAAQAFCEVDGEGWRLAMALCWGDTPPASPRDGPPCSDGVVQGAAGGAGGI
jgi:hypothetical protein